MIILILEFDRLNANIVAINFTELTIKIITWKQDMKGFLRNINVKLKKNDGLNHQQTTAKRNHCGKIVFGPFREY